MIRAPLTRTARAPVTLVIGALVCGLLGLSPRAAIASPPELLIESGPDASALPLVRIRVKPKNNRKLAARLGAELGSLGYEVEPIDVPGWVPTLGPALLDRLAGASAAIEVVVGGSRIEVWVADAATRTTVVRRYSLRDEPEMEDPRTLAIAATELLRVSQLEAMEAVVPTPVPQQSEGERPPGEPEPEPMKLPYFGSISLAPVLGGSARGPGLTTHIEVAGRWAPLRRFALRAQVWVPTYGNLVESDAGSAHVFLAMAFVEPQLRLPGGVRWFHPDLGVGVGAALTTVSSKPNEGLRSRSEFSAGFAGHAHLGLGFEVSPRVWIRLDGYVGMILPYPKVVFLDEVVAQMGFPFGSGAIGLELWL